MQKRGILVRVILLIYILSMVAPVLAVSFVDNAVICADKPAGYEDFTPHYQFKGYSSEPHFPPGSTVYIYVEATGKTKENTKTGQYEPSILFEMEGERLPTGGTFSASTSSDKRINDAVTSSKKAYGVISYKIDKDAIEGRYRIKIIAKDKNDGNNIIARGPYMQFQVQKNATLYAPYNFKYKDLNITPNPAKLGQTVTVFANVTNIGGKADLKGKDVSLFYGSKKLTDNLHLSDDETKKIEFKLSENELNEIGIYNIIIGDLNGTLVVEELKEAPSPSKTKTPDGGRRTVTPGFEVIYAVFGIVVVVYLMNKRKG